MFIPEPNPKLDGRGEIQRDAFLARFVRDFDHAVEYNAKSVAVRLTGDLQESTEKAQHQALGEWRRADTFDDKLREIRDLVMVAPDDVLAQQILEVVDRNIDDMIEAKWPSPKKKKSDDEPVVSA
jgi:hypothetical protein